MEYRWGEGRGEKKKQLRRKGVGLTPRQRRLVSGEGEGRTSLRGGGALTPWQPSRRYTSSLREGGKIPPILGGGKKKGGQEWWLVKKTIPRWEQGRA